MSDPCEWRESLQVGDDVVIVSSRIGGCSYAFAEVDKVTKTQITCGSRRFQKRNGRMLGSERWHGTYIHEPTEEMRITADNYIRRTQALRVIDRANLDSHEIRKRMPLEQLEAIAEALTNILQESPDEQAR